MKIFGLIGFGLALAMPALAQERREYIPPPLDYSADYTLGPQYRAMVRLAMARAPEFNFMSFRSRYAMQPDYDPVGQAASADLLKRAYDVQSAPEPNHEAERAYSEWLSAHLANLDVVTQALSLSRQDPRFGDLKMLMWMREGILRSVLQSGDGLSLASAYDVVTIGEETALLQVLGYNVLATQTLQSSTTFYNVHTVIDDKTQSLRSIFVNVTTPMRRLQSQQQENRFSLDSLRY